MGELSWWHWLIVIGVAMLLFGAKRLPDAARSLGQSTRILKAELRADADERTAPTAPPAPSADQAAATAPPASAPGATAQPAAGAPPAAT